MQQQQQQQQQADTLITHPSTYCTDASRRPQLPV